MNEYMRMADRMYDLDNQFEQLKMKKVELEQENNNLLDVINGQEVKIKELEDHLAEEVELHLHAEEYIKSLEQQIEKMKCCGNCRFSESDTLNGTFCHREGCFVVASAKCKLWEM